MSWNESRSAELASIVGKLVKLEESAAQIREQLQRLLASDGAPDGRNERGGADKTPSRSIPASQPKTNGQKEVGKVNKSVKFATFPNNKRSEESSKGLVGARLAAFESSTPTTKEPSRPFPTSKKGGSIVNGQGNSSTNNSSVNKNTGRSTPPSGKPIEWSTEALKTEFLERTNSVARESDSDD